MNPTFIGTRLTALIALMACSLSLSAQINPINVWETIPGDLNVCADSSELEVRTVVFNSSADNATVQITFPPGTFYVPGSIEIEAAFTNNGLGLVESDLSDPNSPIFEITPADLTLEDSLAFRITRYANCDYIGYSGDIVDEISISHDGPTPNPVVVNSLAYNTNSGLLTPQYTATGRDTLIEVTGLPSQVVCREFNVTQGDVGIIRNPIVHQVELGPDVLNYSLSFDGGVLTPDSTVGQLLYYTIDLSQAPFAGNVGNGDDLFENGEMVVFEECFQVNGCSQASNAITHVLSWGCQDQACQVTPDYTGSVAVQGNAPALSVSRITNDNPTCLDGVDQGHVAWEVTNTSANDATYQFRVNVRTNQDVGSWVLDDSYIEINGVQTSLADLNPDIEPVTGSGVTCGENIQQITVRDIVIPAGTTAEIHGFWIACCMEFCSSQRIPDLFDLVSWGFNPCSGDYDFINRNRYFPNNGAKSAQEPLASGDVFLQNGESAEFCIEYPGYRLMTLVSDPATAYIDFTVGLPTGMMFTPGSFEIEFGVETGTTATGTPSSTMMNATMDTVTLRYPVGQFLQANIERLFRFCYEASLDSSKPGAMGGVQSINYGWVHNPNPSCSPECIIPMRCDDTYELLLGFPGPCPDGGGVITSTEGQRDNVYLADYNDTRQYDPAAPNADPDSVRLDRMSPGDTLCIQTEGRVVDGLANAVDPFIYGEIRHNMSWGQVMDAQPAEGIIVLGGTSYPFSGLVPTFSASGSTAGTFTYDVSPANLNMLNSAIPMGEDLSQADGDSVYIETCYRFDADPRWIDQMGSSLSGSLEGVADNFTTTNFFVSTDEVDYYTCNTGASAVTLVSVGTLHTSTGSTSNFGSAFTASCGEINPFSWYLYNYRGRLLASRDFDFYPNEFRPMMKIDTFYIEKEPGFDLSRVRHITYTRNAAGSNIILQDDPSIAFTDLGDRYMILYEDLWEDAEGALNYYEDNVWFRILPYFTNNCELSENTLVEIDGDWTFNNPENDGEQISEGRTLVRWYLSIGDFSYVQAPFIINATSTENEVLMLTTNEDNRDISFTWLQVVPNPDVEVTNVSIGGTDMVFNPAGFWELGTHAASATRNIEMQVSLQNCAPTDLEVIYGWNCMGYPDAVDASACSFDTIPFLVQPIEAQISLNITDQPDALLDLCEPYTVAIDYASVFQADVIDPGVEILALPGLTLDEVRGTYIGNTGTQEVMPITVLPNGNWYIDFTDHSAVTGDSLPGVISDPMSDPRLFQLECDFGTSCDFNPGQRMRFIGRGFSPCGDPAINAGVTTSSSPVLINGANPYQLGFNVNVDQSEFPINGCGGGSATLEVEALVLGGSTTDADTIVTELPAGVEYVAGSYVCNSVDPANCPTFGNYEIMPDGSSILKLAIPENIASFEQMDFSFDIATTFVEACSDSLPYSIRNLLTIDNVECGSGPGAFTCPDPIVSILGEYLDGFDVDKVEPNVMGATACEDVSGVYNIGGEVEITGFDIMVGDTLFFEVYCPSSPTVPIGGSFVTGPAIVGDFLPFAFSTPAACGSDGELILRFLESNNCICEELEFTVPITTPVVTVADQTVCSGDDATFTAMVTPGTGGTVSYQWQDNSGGTFADIAGETNSTLTVSTTDALDGRMYRVIVTEMANGIGCTAQADATLNVIVNPEVTVADPFTVCGTQDIDLTVDASITPASLGGTWSAPDGDGVFLDTNGDALTAPYTFGTAVTYRPGTNDKRWGSVTLNLTSADPAGPCGSVEASVTIDILKVDCGEFPWNGNN